MVEVGGGTLGSQRVRPGAPFFQGKKDELTEVGSVCLPSEVASCSFTNGVLYGTMLKLGT